MARRPNPYADPALTQAFNNLAGMFAPPGGADMAGYANAAAKRAEKERMDWLFQNYNDPSASARSSLTGVQTYGQTPTGFMQTDATNRRGQDVDATTKMRQTEMQQSGETTRTMLAPVGQGATRFVPPSLAGMYGVPQQQVGVISASPGERITTPDGRVIEGAPKPMSQDELVAKVMQDQLSAGGITPQAIMGPKLGTPQTVMGPQGPRLMSPGEAMLSGATPAPSGAGGARKDGQAVLPDGTRIPVTRSPDGLQWQTADGSPVPQGAVVSNLPTPQGSNEQLGLGTTANKSRAQAIRGTVANADRLMADIDQTIRSNPAATGVAASIINLGQDIGQVAKEFGEKFGATNAPITPQAMQELTQRLTGTEYNPVYRRVRAQLLELAYTNARLNNPSGEVSRFALERELEALGLSNFTGNDQAVLATLGAARDRLRRSLTEADVLEGVQRPPTPNTLYSPSGATPQAATAPQTTPQQPGAVERFVRDPVTGKVTRVQ